MKDKLKKRKKEIILFILISIIFILLYFNIFSPNLMQTVKDLIMLILSAFISSIIAVYYTKRDILENELISKTEKYGLITIEKDHKAIFDTCDGRILLKTDSWEKFFRKSCDGNIYIVGITMASFFVHDTDKYRKLMFQLAKENFSVNIIIANPNSKECILRSDFEKKPSSLHIKNRINNTVEAFRNEYKNTKEKEMICKNLHLFYSSVMPTAAMWVSGDKMILSPYTYSGPGDQPTLIIKQTDSESFYDKYKLYINMLIENGTEVKL